MISLGENIKAARKKMGITQEELATQIGVTSQAVSRWESGGGMPDISLIVPIARVLSVSADCLFGIEHENTDEVLYEEEMKKFSDRQLGYMKAYTEEFAKEKRQEILARFKEWHGEEKCQMFEKQDVIHH